MRGSYYGTVHVLCSCNSPWGTSPIFNHWFCTKNWLYKDLLDTACYRLHALPQRTGPSAAQRRPVATLHSACSIIGQCNCRLACIQRSDSVSYRALDTSCFPSTSVSVVITKYDLQKKNRRAKWLAWYRVCHAARSCSTLIASTSSCWHSYDRTLNFNKMRRLT